ncbi:MAG: OB-fold domain-containing protein [Chloroflexi bacterium]|nr:OB-fold domain-containing protein [Chloroflexota bacterium]
MLVQRCRSCGTFRHPPRPGCFKCSSLDKEWVRASGRGTVYSYTIVPFSIHPATDDKVPYNVVLVELADAGGVRLVSSLVDCHSEAIYIGMPVELVWDDISQEITLPRFRPTGAKFY